MAKRFGRALCWFVWAALFLTKISTWEIHAAGVTLITHGAQLNNAYPDWLDAMGEAIARRAGPSTAIVHLEIAPNSSGGLKIDSMRLEGGIFPSQGSENGEVVIKVFWHEAAGLTDPYTTAQVAQAVLPFLVEPVNWGNQVATPVFSELPLHLVGHSRGGSVMAELCRLLGGHGIWVDHLTTLDPHPLSADDCLGLLCPVVFDPEARIFENVIFADNYREKDDSGLLVDISGYHIDGTAELDLTPRFDRDGLDDSNNSDHLEVHDWYHGTIDWTATSVAGAPIPRAAWYNTNDIGFSFSLIGGETAFRFQQQTNYSGTGLKWLGAPRVAASSHAGSQWPNVELESFSRKQTVHLGEIFPLQLWFQNSLGTNAHAVSVELFFDADRNPYNNAGQAPVYAISDNSSSNAVQNLQIPWAVNAPIGKGFLLAKVSDANGRRFYYAPQALEVAAATVRFSAISRQPDRTVSLRIASEPNTSVTIQFSADLSSWTTLTNVITAAPETEIVDATAGRASRRFYRASIP